MDSAKNYKKLKNPRAEANPLSVLTFWWLIKTFRKGYKKDLEVTDIFEPLPEHNADILGDKIERLWNEEVEWGRQKNCEPSFLKVLARCFALKIMLHGLRLLLLEVCIRPMQPLLLSYLLQYFDVSRNERISLQEAYMYAGGIVLITALQSFIFHPYMFKIGQIGMKMRLACCSLLYRKVLHIGLPALGETTIGQVVNLMANDAYKLDTAINNIHHLWIGPVQMVLVTVLLWKNISLHATIGMIVYLLYIPLQGFFVKAISSFRLMAVVRTDERICLMNEIIYGMNVIKMYTWEPSFAKLVKKSRENEIKWIGMTVIIKGIQQSFIMFSARISTFISAVAYVMLGNQITAAKVFMMVTNYEMLRNLLAFYPQGVGQAAEGFVAIKRIQKFLLKCEEKGFPKLQNTTKLNEGSYHMKSDTQTPGNVGIKITEATASWSHIVHENTLNKITLHIKPGSTIAVIGPVGSGKTSLLHLILRELPLSEGTMEAVGSLAYAPQEPWVFASTVRQNILFGQPFLNERYNKVVEICQLDDDFQFFPYGDNSLIGDRGITLSGGQKARVNLARAVYKNADIYLLDDPLSAVDPQVGKHLFDDCITGFLQDKIVILATHQLHLLKYVDQLIILNNGSISACGTYNELQATGLDFAKLLLVNNECKDDSEGLQWEHISKQDTVLNATPGDEKNQNEPEQVKEMRSTGSVKSKVYSGYFHAGGNCFIIFLVFSFFILAQIFTSSCDLWLTFWTNTEQKRWTMEEKGIFKDTSFRNFKNESSNDTGQALTLQNNEFNNDISMDFNASQNYVNWDMTNLPSVSNCIYTYLGIIVISVVAVILRPVVFFLVCMRASANLHNNMFRSIIHAAMNFFHTNPAGWILNRFSKDMGIIDEQLPICMFDSIQLGLVVCASLIIITALNYWMLIPTIFYGIAVYYIRVFYMPIACSIKRLDGIARSPIFQHLSASLQGLTIIRAFKAEKILQKEFDNHQDLHAGAWYLFLASSRAFGFWVESVLLFYIISVNLSFLILGEDVLGGNVGLCITQAMILSGRLQWGLKQSTEMENQMTSVERVLEFTEVEQETLVESQPDKKPPSLWPSEGVIKFNHLFLRYSKGAVPVLKDLCFTIQAKEKIGVVGRTGAGKSSLISALFRVAYLEGTIYIDGIDISTIDLHDLRQKLSIIPQEPVLFSGTLRKNLDPFDEHPDSKLWEALEEVEMKVVVSDLPDKLNSKILEGGSNLSVGQRQLVCLARAIIRSNPILLLDEATANIDPRTDTLVQKTIREKFANCTVLTIAHRLNTVMDNDKVMVMDAGLLVEYDHPHLLLQNKDGFFYNMVQQMGEGMAEVLTRKAHNNFRTGV